MSNDSLPDELREIIKTVNKFRRKHRLVHVQISSLDTKWVEEKGEAKAEQQCPNLSCPQCSVSCEHDDSGDDCDCDCICDCECECDDCTECNKCLGDDTEEGSFGEYWSKVSPHLKQAPIGLVLNQMDADEWWYQTADTPKVATDAIAQDIAREIANQQSYVEECIQERVEAQENEAKALTAINRLKTLQRPGVVPLADMVDEDEEFLGFDSGVERFKRLDLD